MLSAIWVLVRAQLLIAKNTVLHSSILRKLGYLALLGLVLLGAWLTYGLMRGVVETLESPRFLAALREAARVAPEAGIPIDPQPFLTALPSGVLFWALLALVFTSFGSVLGSLYLAGDLDTLVVAPVPMRAVFVVKLFGGLTQAYLLLLAVVGPGLLGYGAARGYSWAFYAALGPALLLFPLLPTSLGALAVMGLVRVIPARRARDLVGALGALLGVGWYVLTQFSPEIAPRVASVQTLDDLRSLDVPLLPSAWVGRALVAAGTGEWLTLAVFGGLFAAVSLASFAACVVLAERLYYAGWSNVSTQGGRVRQRAAGSGQREHVRQPWYLAPLAAFLPPEALAVAVKDMRIFPRDLRSLQQVIFPLALAAIWSFQLVAGDGEPGTELVESLRRAVGPAAIGFFVCLSLSNALGGPSISREGPGFWMLKVAPVSAWRVLLGKLAVAYLPFPLVGTLLVAALAALQGNGLLELLVALALVLVVGLGASALALGLGAAFPRFNWETPQQQTTLIAGCLTPLLYLGYIGLAAGLSLGPLALGGVWPEYQIPLTATGWVLLLSLTALVTWGSLAFGAARLERVEV